MLMQPSREPQRESEDLVRWLENKLGSNELWGGQQASSVLTMEILVELETCFQELEPATKTKIIQAMAHLSMKTLQEWKEPLLNLLELARRDPDDWVETMADLYRQFPDLGFIQSSSNSDSYFSKTLEELNRIVLRRTEQTDEEFPFPLPPDSELLGPSTIKATFGRADFGNMQKHFERRNVPTKFDKMLAEVCKASEQQNNPQNRKSHLISSFPIKIRSTAKKLNNDLPMRAIPSTSALKMSCGFTNDTKKFQQRPALQKKKGGAQLIEIAEIPQPNKRRRNNTATTPTTTESRAQLKKKLGPLLAHPLENSLTKRGKAATNVTTGAKGAKSTGNGIDKKGEKKSTTRNGEAANGTSVEESEATEEVKLLEPMSGPDTSVGEQHNPLNSDIIVDSRLTENGVFSFPVHQHQPNNFLGTSPDSSAFSVCQQQVNPVPNSAFAQTAFEQQLQPFPIGEQHQGMPSSCFNNLFAEIGRPPPQQSAQQQMINHLNPNNEALAQFKSLLKDANKLTTTSYNMIVSFLSGNKNNPLQNKLGTLITLPLSESVEMDTLPNGELGQFVVETYFQMNYGTGEWKRLRKSRLVNASAATAPMYGGGGDEGTAHQQQQGNSAHTFQQQQQHFMAAMNQQLPPPNFYASQQHFQHNSQYGSR